jgi:molecular chaperone GrpE (heat shock protein)
MTDRSAPKLAIWPFIIADIVFLGLAGFIFSVAHKPLTFGVSIILLACTAAGAWSFLTPFLRRHAAELKLAESEKLATTVAQIQNLEQIAAQLSSATNHLKETQDQSTQTVAAAKGIADKMAEESRAFSEFIQKANDTEKSHLRLEVEKLRRAEADWLQILIHILDHVHALHQAAVRSGKPALIEQIGAFQNICRDTARRIGVVCHTPDAGQKFDEKLHQVMDGEPTPENGAALTEALASGFSYQGRIVRRALVRVQSEINEVAENSTTEEKEATDSESSKVSENAGAEKKPAGSAQESLF